MAKFNIIGFWDKPQSRWTPTKTCPYHHCVLIPKRDESGVYEPGVLQCPECGTPYLEKDAETEEQIKGKHRKQQSRIVQPKKKKKYYDKQGNEITDPDLIQDIKQGKTVVYYKEEKLEDKQQKYLVRRR